MHSKISSKVLFWYKMSYLTLASAPTSNPTSILSLGYHASAK